MIKRYLSIEKSLKNGKTLIIFGPRRTGKTTLLNEFTNNTKLPLVSYNGDNLSTQTRLSYYDIDSLRPLVGSAKVIVIDEAQSIPNIGKSLKIINDNMPDVAVVVTGSASFELAGQIGEPLVGRKITKFLFPLSIKEIVQESITPQLEFEKKLPQLLVYGTYPNSITALSNEERMLFLDDLVNSLLLKDVLAYQQVKSAGLLMRLLTLLAYQIGGEVSFSELASSLEIDKKTVERYIDLLEKSFIIFRLGGFSRNLRSEITKTSRYYFYDVGVRNAIINNFNPLEIRNDVGQLWENFAIVERLKSRSYNNIFANQYFWRTWKKSEIDLVEERSGKYFGYEMKWKPKKHTVPTEWTSAYGDTATWQIITPDNFLVFLDER